MRFLPQELQHTPETEIAAIPKHLIVKYIVAATEEIGPVPGLRYLQQRIVVAVVSAQPIHRGLKPLHVVAKKVEVVRPRYIRVEGDDEP